jgi:hypothetical protein
MTNNLKPFLKPGMLIEVYGVYEEGMGKAFPGGAIYFGWPCSYFDSLPGLPFEAKLAELKSGQIGMLIQTYPKFLKAYVLIGNETFLVSLDIIRPAVEKEHSSSNQSRNASKSNARQASGRCDCVV